MFRSSRPPALALLRRELRPRYADAGTGVVMQHTRSGATLVAIGALAALPAGAQAATKTVYMGAPPKVAGPLMQKDVESLNYFPLKTTIRAGGKVKFVVTGFHTLELASAGGGGPGGGGGSGGPKIMGALDAAGAPFWFNSQSAGDGGPGGPPAPPAFGKTFTLPSPKGFSSGFPFAPRPKPITIKFAKAGTYNFFCLIHPGMKTSVKVVGRSGRVPSAKADARVLAEQVRSLKKVAKDLSKTSVPANTVSMGAEKAGTHFFGFLPGTLSVAPGTTVTFSMPTAARETHTATFGPGNRNARWRTLICVSRPLTAVALLRSMNAQTTVPQ